ncbi:phage major capsid protein [Terrilactibacillus sp. BCM23-1]|uniref:Phage major capsid protein n=1 Tax=Terrilactibacillus tamarindi TaxID=2599694 RepID=A0A6N8CU97_9BACI|nr:DUF5309 family protein [Terrilactibacillus tamarindi]MTT32703.1 phage major capsid protein [Terrilactibacillus tamarindi]
MFKSDTFTPSEKISLSREIALIGVEQTPLTSMLMAQGKLEKALSTVYTWKEKTIDSTDDLSAVEGSDDLVLAESAKRELSNVLEIFKKGASISGTASAMKSNQFSEEINDRLLEVKINIENKLINGVKNDGSVSPFKRQLSGLIEFADASNAIGGAVTKQNVKDMARKLWDQKLVGGNVFAFVNADIKEQIDALYEGNVTYNAPVDTFGVLAQNIITNYGTIKLVLSRHVPADKAVFFNDAYVGLANLRDAHFEPLAKTGDSTKGQIVAETTLKVASPKAVGVFTLA